MRRVNAELLRGWAEQTDQGLSQLEKDTGLSLHTLYKMAHGGYNSEPNKSTRRLMCAATGIDEDELFPEVEDGKAS